MPLIQVKLIENVFTPAQKQAPYFRANRRLDY
jgi:hypothetical protein